MTLSLHLVGQPFVQVGQDRVALPQKHLAILAVLADRAPRTVAREYLAALLWPTSGPRSRRHSLAQAIYALRKRLGGDILTVSSSVVGLGPVQCDLSKFRQLARHGSVERAAGLIRGEFCEDLIIPECVEFEQWVENVRLEVREAAHSLMNAQIDSAVRESLAVALTLDAPPSSPSEVSAAQSSSDRSSPFVGRVRERQLLEQCWRRAQGGKVATALVTGEVGIGKTTLCTRIVKKSVLQGTRALTAVGYELQRNLPYGIIGQLLRDADRSRLLDKVDPYWRDVLSDLIPSARPRAVSALAGAISEGLDHRFAGAFCHLLEQATHLQPITVFVDDIQWADSASMSILQYLAHYNVDLPIFLLLASRETNTNSFRKEDWFFHTSLELKGLDLAESELFVEEISLSEKPVDCSLLHRLSAGNPYLLSALAMSGGNVSDSLPESVKEYFDKRLDALHPDAVSIGAALHTAGGRLCASELSWISELDSEEMDLGLNELISEGIVEVVREDGSFVLQHQMIGQVFLSRFQPVALAKLHGRVARLLRDRGSPAAVVATQMTIAGNDPETCAYALQAAEGSERLYAYQEAEHFYRIAIGSAEDPSTELAARIALARVLLRQGRSSDAEVLLRRFTHQNVLGKAEQASWEAQLLITQLTENSPAAFPRHAYNRALQLEALLPAALATELYVAVAANAQHGLHELLGDATRAAQRPLRNIEDEPNRIRLDVLISAYQTVHAYTTANLDRLKALTQSSSQWPATHVACLSAYSFVGISRGLAVDAENSLVKALEVCERFGFLDERLRVLNNLGVCLLEQGKFAEAEEQFSVVARSGGSVAPKEIPGALNNLLITEYEKGDYETVMELGRKHLREPFLQARLRVGVLGVLGLASLE
ncbi:MAG: AAA family ATPase, partial [Thioalkalivibrio sp.]|nr:AAA family ATPase [Thioalkalivibrio sp.]